MTRSSCDDCYAADSLSLGKQGAICLEQHAFEDFLHCGDQLPSSALVANVLADCMEFKLMKLTIK